MVQLIGVAGGSGSGKTTLAELLLDHFGRDRAALLLQDSYYIDRSQQFKGDGSLNFDHPDAIDWPLLLQHLQDLQAGRAINEPTYDFVKHQRNTNTIRLEPKEIIIVDGILLYVNEAIRNLFDIRLYVDTSEQMRYARRLLRDVELRGRTPEGVRIQYESTVKPMHQLYVEPCKAYAHAVVSGERITDLRVPDIILA